MSVFKPGEQERQASQLARRWLLPETSGAFLVRAVAVAWLLRMVVVALVVRDLPDPSRGFEQFGWEMGWVARSIANGQGFSSPFIPITGPTALVPPGFPYLLAGIFKIFGLYSLHSGIAILSLDALFSALTCLPVYLIARDTVGIDLARCSTWAWVIYPFSIYYSTVVWEWSLTALLFSTCVWLVLHLHSFERAWKWAGFGVLYGATALVNPAVLSVLPFLFGIALWKRRQLRRTWFLKAAATIVAVTFVLLPWTIRTWRTMHIVVPIRDGYWLEFYAGNNGDTFESNAGWAHPASNPVEMQRYRQLGEARYLAEKHTLAVAFVTGHPGWFAVATMRRFVRYWTGFWSFSARYLKTDYLDVPNFFFCTTMTVLMVRGSRRLWCWNRVAALPLLTVIAAFPLTYYLSHASMDYRQPIEPVIVILVVLGCFKSLRSACRLQTTS